MDEFNQRFTELSNAIPAIYKPPAPSILLYYIEALSGKMQYQIRDKEPTTLLNAQEMAVKIDRNMQSSGESNLPGYSKSSTLLKSNEHEEEDSYRKQMMEIKERLGRMEDKHLAQMKEMQNKVISMERAQSQPVPRTFPPKVNWQRKAPNHEQRPPHQLESTDMVETYTPFCRACEDLHEESSCYYACYVQEHGFPEVVVLKHHQASLST